MAVYDSAKTREAAAQIRKLAEGMDGDVRPGMQGVSECVEALRGKTARAMEDRLAQLSRTASSLSAELGELARRVNAYADLLEQTDAQLAEEL